MPQRLQISIMWLVQKVHVAHEPKSLFSAVAGAVLKTFCDTISASHYAVPDLEEPHGGLGAAAITCL